MAGASYEAQMLGSFSTNQSAHGVPCGASRCRIPTDPWTARIAAAYEVIASKLTSEGSPVRAAPRATSSAGGKTSSGSS